MTATIPNVVGVITPEQRTPDWFRVLIHGPQGSGKTTLASTIADLGPTLFLDLVGEKGTRSYQGTPWEKNITPARPDSATALDDTYWWLASGDHPFKAVVLDSLTATQKMTMRFMLGHSETAVREIRQGTAPADQRTWGQTLDIMTDLATFWFGLADGNREHPMHVVMTAQTKVTEDEDSGTMRRTPDVQKGALSITLAAPDYILYTDLEEDMDHPGEDGSATFRHIVRFGANPEYRTKARLPYRLWGKLPSIMGRSRQLTLPALGRTLGVGGVPRQAAGPQTAAPTTQEEQPV